MRVIALAKFTLKSYLQEKVLLVVMIFAALLMLSSYVLSPLAVGAQQKIVVDIGLAAISIFAVALIVLLGAGSFHLEKERGILRALLAKPISRVEFVLGKYFGTVAMVSIVVMLMASVHMLVVTLSGGEVTDNMLSAVYLTILEGAVVTALLTLFSSFSSPMLGSFFTISCVVAGHFSSDLLTFAERMGGNDAEDRRHRRVLRAAQSRAPQRARGSGAQPRPPVGLRPRGDGYAVAYAAVVLYLATVDLSRQGSELTWIAVRRIGVGVLLFGILVVATVHVQAFRERPYLYTNLYLAFGQVHRADLARLQRARGRLCVVPGRPVLRRLRARASTTSSTSTA